MSVLLLWMNTNEAKLFQLEKEKIHVENVRFHGHQHHSEGLGMNHPKHQTDEYVFFRQLADKVNSFEFSKILIMGPGLAAKHFEKMMLENYSGFSDKIIGVEKVDQMPDSEILSVGRRFLHKYYVYQGMIG